jgi:hypothetical protein
MARASEEPIKLPPKIWTALDYAVTVTAHWTSDGRVYLDFLDPYCSVVESAFRAILTSVDGPGQIGFLGYFVEEEQVDRLLEAFEKSPGAAQLIGKKLAMAYYYDNRMPEPLRCQRRSKNRPYGGAKSGQWRGATRHGARADHIACAGHGALACRANSVTDDQVSVSSLRARLWPSR